MAFCKLKINHRDHEAHKDNFLYFLILCLFSLCLQWHEKDFFQCIIVCSGA